MEIQRTIRIVADPSQARAQIAGLKSQIASLSGARVSGDSFSRLEGQINGAASAAGNLGSQVSASARAAAAANDNHASSLRGVSGALSEARGHGGALGAVLEEIKGKAAGAIPEVGGLASKLLSLSPATAIIGAVALGILAVGKASIDAAAETQRWMAQLTTVTKSSQLAKESYAALVQFATKTPFDLGQSIEAFTKLRSLGLAATEGRLTSFGNTASAMGKSLNQMIEAVADASTGEFERLKEFGIKSKTVGDQVAFTFQGVTTKVGKNSTEITQYLEKIGNTNFAGAMDKQMDTLSGAFSNVGDALQQALSAIGSGKLGESVKEIAQGLANGISYITPFLASIGNLFGGIIAGVGGVINGLAAMWGGFGYVSTAQGLLTGLTVAFNLIGESTQAIGSIIGSVFGFVGQVASNLGSMLLSTFGSVLPDLSDLFDTGSRSWANSIVGVLRAAKTVVDWLPRLFRVAVSDIVQMFGTLGSAMGNLLSGNFHAFDGIGAKLKADGASTVKALGATWTAAQAVFKDQKGADNAINKLLGKNSTKAKLASGLDAKPTPNKKDDDDAEKKAKKLADFWTGLQTELDQAKLFGIELAKVTKEKELQKILERDLTLAEKNRVDGMVQDITNAKAVTDLRKSALDLDLKTQASQARALNLTDDQAKLQDALDAKTHQAKLDGVDVAGQIYQQELAAYRLSFLRNQAEEKRVALMKSAVETAKKFSPAYAAQSEVDALERQKADFLTAFGTGQLADAWGKPLSQATRDAVVAGLDRGIEDEARKPQLDALGAAANSSLTAKAALAKLNAGIKQKNAQDALATSGLDPEQMEQAGREIANSWQDDMNAANRLIADDFARRMGAVGDLLNHIGSLIGGKAGGAVSQLGNAVTAFGSFASTQLDVKNTITDAFGKNSGPNSLASKIGDKVGGAVAGLGIGESIGKLGTALGIKGGETGSKIGGAIGGLAFGPLGAIAGGVLGSIFGSLFRKIDSSNSSFSKAADGTITAGATGSNSQLTAATSGAAGEVLTGLGKIASALGGTLSGTPNLTIGTWDGKWRVLDNQQTTAALHSKNFSMGQNLHDFGADGEAQAVAYAITQALKQGVITGLGDLAQKALSALDSDSAISFIQSWTSAMSDFKSMTDPVGAAVDAVITPLKSLQATMVKVGASTADMTKLEQYRSAKLAQVLKEQTSSIRSFLDNLQGDDGGVSKVTQMATTLAKLKGYDSDILGGKAIDQTAFQDLLSKAVGLNKDIYGANTTAFADNVALFQTYGQDLLDSITKNFNTAAGLDTTTAAVEAQTDQVTASIGITNDILGGVSDRLDTLIALYGGTTTATVVGKNGEYTGF